MMEDDGVSMFTKVTDFLKQTRSLGQSPGSHSATGRDLDGKYNSSKR